MPHGKHLKDVAHAGRDALMSCRNDGQQDTGRIAKCSFRENKTKVSKVKKDTQYK